MKTMNGNFFVRVALSVAGVMALASCQKPENETPSPEKVTLTAVAEQTRTSLGSDDAVLWSADDTFWLFGDSGVNSLFELIDGAGTSTASFEGYLPEGESFFAAYPSDLCAGSDNGWLQMMLPQEQTYVRGTFADGINPMVASAAGDFSQLNFRNVCGILELRITGEGTLSSVVLSSNQAMSGQISVPMWSDGVAQVAASDQGLRMTGINETLSATEPLSLYFVVPAGTYESLSVLMTDAAGAVVEKMATEPVTIERAAITPVEGLVFEQAEAETVEVKMTVNTDKSNWKTTSVRYEVVGNVEVSDLKLCSMTTALLEENLAAGLDLEAVLSAFGQILPLQTNPCEVGWSTMSDTQQSFLAGAIVEGELIGEVVRLDYRTAAMTIDPSLGFDPSWTVGDTYVAWTSTVTGGATRYYSFLGMGPIWGGLSDSEVIMQIIQNDPDGTELTDTAFDDSIDGLFPETQYEFFVLFEGPNGFSQLYRYPFTTLPLQPGDDTAEYRQFIGTWSMSYIDLLGTDVEEMTITVKEDVVGRTYRVSGLMGSYAALGNVADDTIVANFENGTIVFGRAIPAATTGDFASLYFYPLGSSEGSLDGMQYIGTYADDTVTFANGNAEYINGYTFIGTIIDGSIEHLMYASSVYGDVVWTRQSSAGSGNIAIVEDFVRDPAVNPVWK